MGKYDVVNRIIVLATVCVFGISLGARVYAGVGVTRLRALCKGMKKNENLRVSRKGIVARVRITRDELWMFERDYARISLIRTINREGPVRKTRLNGESVVSTRRMRVGERIDLVVEHDNVFDTKAHWSTAVRGFEKDDECIGISFDQSRDLFALASKMRIVVFNVADGSVFAEWLAPRGWLGYGKPTVEIVSPPAFNNKTDLYVATRLIEKQGSRLYCLRLPKGSVAWSKTLSEGVTHVVRTSRMSAVFYGTAGFYLADRLGLGLGRDWYFVRRQSDLRVIDVNWCDAFMLGPKLVRPHGSSVSFATDVTTTIKMALRTECLNLTPRKILFLKGLGKRLETILGAWEISTGQSALVACDIVSGCVKWVVISETLCDPVVMERDGNQALFLKGADCVVRTKDGSLITRVHFDEE